VVPPRAVSSDVFIPGDGHPTGEGNRRSAAWLADFLERDAALRKLLAGS
jgi:hypothetical protein